MREDEMLNEWIERYSQSRFEEDAMHNRMQQLNRERLNQSIDDFAADWWDEELRELQPRRLPYLLPVLVVLLALGAILGAVLIEGLR